MRRFSLAGALLTASAVLAGCGGGSPQVSPQVDHSVPLGAWGGGDVSDPVSLGLTATGGHFGFSCGRSADFSQPLQPDGTGHFDVAGTSALSFGVRIPLPTHSVGTVTNHTMTVTFQTTAPNGMTYPDGPYTVTFGQAAPVFQGACPG